MASAWFNSLVFATSSLCATGVLLAVWLGCAAQRATRIAGLLCTLLTVLAVTAAGFAIIAAISGQPLAIWGSATAIAALYALVVALPSVRFARVVAAAAQLARGRHCRRVAMLGVPALCPFLALAIVYSELDTEEGSSLEESIAASHTLFVEPTGETDSPLTTDRGRPVRVLQMPADACTPTAARLAGQEEMLTRWDLHDMVIMMPLGWQDTNCHGFVFAASRYWIGGAQVDAILEDNGYQPVEAIHVDDIAVYRDPAGKVMHTAIVRGVASDGVVLVESKWGQAGRFVHRHDRQPYPDAACTFYRSPRPGHLLRGLPAPSEGSPAPPSPQPPATREAVVGL